MVTTRRGVKRSVEEVEEPAIDDRFEPLQGENSSDDEAPEEFSLSKAKKDATLLRKQEKEAKRKAQIDAKNRRRHRQTAEEPILTADKDNEDGGRDDINNEHNNDIELDILPDDVLAAIAEEEEAHDNRIKERRIISEQLRAANPQASRRKIFTERHAGPVTVKAIGSRTSTHYRKPSESATSFLQERMYGGVKRSNEMLQPTKIGNSFLYAPKSS